jgi:hypothetical protein
MNLQRMGHEGIKNVQKNKKKTGFERKSVGAKKGYFSSQNKA